MAVREILAATDFSELADAAVTVAREYASGLGARLHLVHVAPSGELELSDLVARLAAAGVAAIPGDPAEEIVRYARVRGIDLIVVGTHGRHGFTRRLLGSVADKVLRQAPCPVLAVPQQTPPPASATAGPEPREDTTPRT